MIYNALIHGTLSLSKEQRHLSHDQLRKLVNGRLEEGLITDKSIRIGLDLNLKDGFISISVEDDGEGFDHESWLRRLQSEQEINLDAHGRGISMLYHLSDHLEFDKNGRKVTITRALPKD